ncbi:MAG TPA: branched-chain amino acid ABC transporter permease, partial [Castellaniella sp.]|nr:branched-chain amino acid ABC transporter permease [Castellaniella sp.]
TRHRTRVSMINFFQLVISGVATGSIYALVALGFTLLWQASGTINFAAGEFVMLPAFSMLAFQSMGLPLWISFLLTLVVATVLLGYGFKRAIVDPMRKFGVMPLVVATIGLALIMRSGVQIAFGAQAMPFKNVFGYQVFSIAGVHVSASDLGTLIVTFIVVFGLQAFLQRTVTGRAMQAVAQNTETARILGIRVNRMIFYTFAINAILATLAALLVTPIYLAKFDMGILLGLKAFLAAIIGGFNNSRGALLGGVIIGVSENLVGAYISSAYMDGVALALFLLVILFKPDGLLGAPVARKV